MSIHPEGVEHAPCAVDPAVAAGHGRGDDDEVDDTGRCRDPDLGECCDERASDGIQFIPRIHRDDDEDRPDVENQDPPDDALDRFRQGVLRIACLSGRDPDQFHPLVGRHHKGEGEEEARPSAGKEAAVCPQVREPDGVSPVSESEEDQSDPGEDHQDDGDDFNECKPKFEFPEGFHGNQIRRAQDGHGDDPRYPRRQVREPVLHVRPHCDDLGHPDDDPLEPVAPRRHVSGKWMDIFMPEGGERTGARLDVQHFPHGTHDEEDENPGNRIRQQDRRARPLDRTCRSHK